tara:strand:+ start:230 stop:532 length:303 start_codon:yes stop_codon:yes gene_type:complete
MAGKTIIRKANNTGDNLNRDIFITMEDPTKLNDPPHFKYLYLEEIGELDQKASDLLEEAALYDSSGSASAAKASRFIAKTYSATADALLAKAISDPIAMA